MPFIRGRILPEVELTGRVKQFLDILLWLDHLGQTEATFLDELDQLRIYLKSLTPFVCHIRIFVPQRHERTAAALDSFGIVNQLVPEREAGADVAAGLKDADPELLIAVGTGLSIDADCVAVNRREWLPWVEDTDKLGFLLTDCSFLLPYAEVFSRGHDVPWSFRYKSWNAPWTAFYTLAEEDTFKPGLEVLQRAYRTRASSDAQETGRILVHNRLPNLCFTRDRLLFYEIQRLVAKRRGWKRQLFTFEIAYSLNFYYLLIYGAFDHVSQFLNQLFQLGVPTKQVGATYRSFLDELNKKSPALFAIFTEKRNKEFIERIGYLRHFAAHRGSLMPADVFERLEKEPTDAELDADIRQAGLDYILEGLAAGEDRDRFREMLRTNARMARYEKSKMLEGVVFVELTGRSGFIQPHLDTTWNFSRLLSFLNSIFAECSRFLS